MLRSEPALGTSPRILPHNELNGPELSLLCPMAALGISYDSALLEGDFAGLCTVAVTDPGSNEQTGVEHGFSFVNFCTVKLLSSEG